MGSCMETAVSAVREEEMRPTSPSYYFGVAWEALLQQHDVKGLQVKL